MPAGSQRQANLRALVDQASGYRKNQDGSLYGFMKYIDAVKAKKVPMGQVKMVGEDDDTIRIMTIHKSKGLEFPMVLLCGFCRKLNYTSVGKGAAIHKDFGIGLPLVNYKESWFKTTLLQNAVRQRFHQEEVEEEKRVLYVAMTRARDILYILGISDDPSGEVSKVIDDIPKDFSYFTMTGRTICMKRSCWDEVFNADLTGLSRGRKRAAAKAVKLLEQEPGPVDDDIIKRLTFSYPYEKDLSVKSKYSVSELVAEENRQGIDYLSTRRNRQADLRPIELAEPESFKLSSGFTAAQIGTITHKVLENMDFTAASESGASYIEELIVKMVEEEFISRQEADAVDAGKLADFAVSSLGRRIAASPAVYREKPFNLVCRVDGSPALVQGIIDCFFEEDGQLVLVDYKTTNIRSKEEFQRRKGEIAAGYSLQMEL
ncbi:MAG: 3'-5' exonuclease, partial [bacterium]|nr:3'-5' exonuclease [bacterium]